MLQLPWHIERPLATALIVGAAGALCLLLRVAYDGNRFRVRDFLGAYFRRRLGALGPEKADSAARIFLLGMAILWGSMSVFGFVVALGIIRNGERPVPRRSAEGAILQGYLEAEKGRIDVKELMKKNEAGRKQE